MTDGALERNYSNVAIKELRKFRVTIDRFMRSKIICSTALLRPSCPLRPEWHMEHWRTNSPMRRSFLSAEQPQQSRPQTEHQYDRRGQHHQAPRHHLGPQLRDRHHRLVVLVLHQHAPVDFL